MVDAVLQMQGAAARLRDIVRPCDVPTPHISSSAKGWLGAPRVWQCGGIQVLQMKSWPAWKSAGGASSGSSRSKGTRRFRTSKRPGMAREPSFLTACTDHA